MSTDSTPEAPQAPEAPLTTDRVTRRLLVGVGVYSILLVVILNLIVLNSGKLHEKAIFMMADGLILLWIIVGGSLTPFLKKRLVPRLAAIPIDWRLRFVILSHDHGPDRRGHHHEHDQPCPGLWHDTGGSPHHRIDELLHRGLFP